MIVEARQDIGFLQAVFPNPNRAPTEGRRTVGNSPEYFPHLGIPGCKFLHGVATVARSLEMYLLRLPPHYHIPFGIQSIVNVSEALIQRKDNEPVISPPSYSLRSVDLITKPQDKTTANIDPHKIETLEMIFFSNGSSSSVRKVKICLRPNTKRVYKEPRYDFLEGWPKDEVRVILSPKKGKSAEEVAQILDSYVETPAAFRIISDGAELEIIFSEGQASTATSIDNGKEPTVINGLAICRLSITAAESKKKEVAEIPFPLSDFCGTKVPKLQEEIDEWLGVIALDLAKRVKRSK